MKNAKSIGITVLYVLLLLPFFSIAMIRENVSGDVTQAWLVVGFVYMGLILLLFLFTKQLHVDRFMLFFALYEAVICLSTTLNHGINIGILITCMASVLFVVLIRNDRENMLIVLMAMCVILAVANLVTVLILGAQKNVTYFVGGKNRLSIVLYPPCFMAIAESYRKYGKLLPQISWLLILCMLNVLLGGSATGLVVTVLAVAVFLLFRFCKPKTWATVLVLVGLNVIVLFCLNSPLIKPLWEAFTGILGKDSSLTSRSRIWETVFKMLKGKWILGLGRGTQIPFTDSYDLMRLVEESHNFVLELLFEGGIVALVLYAVTFWEAVRKLDRENLCHRMILAGLVVVLLNGLTEANNNIFMVVALLAMANAVTAPPVSEAADGQTL